MLESQFLSDIKLIFVNQIRGVSIRNDPICPTTVNADDGGVQCSLFGPDIFSPEVPSEWNHGTPESFDFASVKLESLHDISSLPITYVKDKSQGCAWMRIRSLQSSATSNLVKKWMKGPKWIPKRSLFGSFFVVTNHNNTPLTREQCINEDNALFGKFFIPDLPSLYNNSTLNPSFHAVTKEDRIKISKKFKSGIYVQEFSSSLNSTIKDLHQVHLISTKKINTIVPDHIEYNGFVQIFAGG